MDERIDPEILEALRGMGELLTMVCESVLNLEKAEQLRQKLTEEYGYTLVGVNLNLNLVQGSAKFIFSVVRLPQEGAEQLKKSIGSEIDIRTDGSLNGLLKDSLFAHGLGIQFNEADQDEIKAILEGASDPNVQQGPAVGPYAGTDTRSVDEIIQSIKALATKLDYNKRCLVAETFNNKDAVELLGVIFADTEELRNNNKWLEKVQEVINRILERLINRGVGNAENVKRRLLYFETMMRASLDIK